LDPADDNSEGEDAEEMKGGRPQDLDITVPQAKRVANLILADRSHFKDVWVVPAKK